MEKELFEGGRYATPAIKSEPKPEAKTEQVPVVQQSKTQVALDDNGLIAPKNFDEQFRFCDMLAKSGMLPKGYVTAAQVMGGMQLARELGLKPMSGLRSIAVINGTPSLHTDGPLAIVMASGHLESIDEYLVDADLNRVCIENKNILAKPAASVCKVKRKGHDAKTFTFTFDQAPKKPGPWTDYKEIMMKRRVRSIALKDVFPDVLNGVAIAEYDFDAMVQNGKTHQTESKPVAVSLNAVLADEKE